MEPLFLIRVSGTMIEYRTSHRYDYSVLHTCNHINKKKQLHHKILLLTVAVSDEAVSLLGQCFSSS